VSWSRIRAREHMKGIAVYEADKNPRVLTSSLGIPSRSATTSRRETQIEQGADKANHRANGNAMYFTPCH